MATIISIEQIGLCRRGSDIDLEAVYGGRISQKKPKGLKVNPIYTGTGDSRKTAAATEDFTDHNGNMNSIHLETYENFPQVNNQNTVTSRERGSEQYSLTKEPDKTPHVVHTSGGSVKSYSEKSGGNLVRVSSVAMETNRTPISNGLEVGVHNPAFNHSENETKQSGESRTRKVSEEETVGENGSSVTFLTEVHVHTASESPKSEVDWPELDDITVSIVNDVIAKRDANNSTDHEKSNFSHQSHDDVQTLSKPSCIISVVQNSHSGDCHVLDSKSNVEESSGGPYVAMDTERQHPTTDIKHPSDTAESHQEQKSQIVDEQKALPSSSRAPKSILSSSGTETSPAIERKRTQSQSDNASHEKCVKFSDDTVFNDDKPKKYKKDKVDRINLREFYRGKISSDSAVAKMNPLFSEDLADESGKGSLTDDEKMAYRLALKSMMGKKKVKGGSINHRERFLVLKTQGLQGSDADIEGLPPGMDTPVYDRLITRTLAKQRRKLIIKWTLVILTVLIVTAVATIIGVYLGNKGG